MSCLHFVRVARMALGVALVLSGAATAVRAQLSPSGRIVGRVVDAKTGQGITAAGVQVVGTTIGTISGLDGRFSIPNVPSGTVTLQVRRIGYNAKTVTGLFLEAGAALEQNVSLDASTVQLQAAVVTADRERGSVSAALDAQRNATQIVNSITAEQIAKSPDGDAAQAVQRVSGATVQDGKYVFVRGLGERYTTASLNGARIPSPEPERKVVPLDLFPSGLLQSITTSKTFTPDLQGDFAGAQVDIRTREFPAARQFSYSISTGANLIATGKGVYVGPRTGGELFGFAADGRAIPSSLSGTNFMATVPQQRYNQIVRDMRNVWSPVQGTGLPNLSAGLTMGGNDKVFGQRIGYVLSGNYGMAQEVRSDEELATGNAGPGGTVSRLSQFKGETGRTSVLWGGIANLSTLVGGGTRISWNNTFTRSADNEARVDRGYDENIADSLRRTTLRYVERGVFSSQLSLEHQLTDKQRLTWSLTSSQTSRKEPDRSDLVYVRQDAPGGGGRSIYTLLSGLDGARRLYFDLFERNTVAQADYQVGFGSAGGGDLVKFGAYLRQTNRSTNAPIFSILNVGLGTTAISGPAEEIFTAANACDACTNFNVQPIGQAGSYTADDKTTAGYLMVDKGLGRRVRIITGARVEGSSVRVATLTQLGTPFGATLQNTDVLPSLVVNTTLGDNSAVRFSVSRTLARPEYRELSPVTFRDVLGGVSVTGSDRLVRTLIDNLDVRWEWFPAAGEVLSVGVFYKHFDKPIERVEVGTSGAAQWTYQNARSASNLGLELEARKELGLLGDWARQLTAFSNVTIMQSSIQLDRSGTASFTNESRPMVGQAPYVINAGLTWSSKGGDASGTLLYNRVGERIVAAGALPLPDVKEQPRDVLDFSVRLPVGRQVSARFDARNLLDARYVMSQSNLVREAYTAGRVISVGLNWRP